ncbi:MAG TPA: 4'-phosphopantetheinyl transferase superfamily protein [Longimicrobiales bacterium]|nr:4'-phosphopantetheinyl transferase superfamily protein [Longimicrobiales bacterium]
MAKRLVEGGEAHVWHVRLDAPPRSLEWLESCLSGPERDRAAIMRSALTRHRFTVARAALRSVLSAYAGVPPTALMLETQPGGKPLLAMAAAPHFSLTHSGARAAIVVAAAPAGIDIEHVRELRRARAAERVLHRDTLAAIRPLDPVARAVAIIDAWTLREAHVKAVGGGLMRTPDILPWQPAEDGHAGAAHGRDGSQWTVMRWSPAPGLRAAVVVSGVVDTIAHFEWDADTHLQAEDR